MEVVKEKISERENIENKIIKLEERFYKIKKIDMKSSQLFNSKKSKKIKKELIKIKTELNDLYLKLNKFNENNINILNTIPYNMIISLDLKFNKNTYELFNMLRLERKSKKRLQLINNIRNIYLDLLKNIDKEDYESKRNIKFLLSYLTDLLKYEKNKNKQSNNNEDVIKEKKDYVKYSYKPKKKDKLDEIYYDILKGNSISHYTLIDIINAYKIIIKKYEINENLIKCLNTIIDRLENEKNNNLNDYIYSLIDSIKIRKSHFDKNDLEYKILKEIYLKLNNYKKIINSSDKSLNNDNNYMFDVVTSLLDDENNYPIVKKIVSEYPNIVNTSKNNKNILVYILELYLENYEKLLTNKEYINIDYLKEVYHLISKSSNYHKDEEVINQINNLIYNFIVRLTGDCNKKEVIIDDRKENTIYIKNEKRKKKIIEEIKKLSTHYFYYDNSYFNMKKINDEYLNYQLDYILNNYSYDESKNDDYDLTEKENIVLDNPYIAYNFSKKTSSNILRVSVCDFTNLIPEDTSLDSYVYNSLLKCENVDERILDKLKFEEGKKIDALTYKISLDKNNNPISLYIYKSKIIPRYLKKYDTSTMYQDIICLVNEIIEKNNYEFLDDNCNIENISKKIINELYLEIAKSKDVPYTYSGVEKIENIDSKVYSILSTYSKKVSREELETIHNAVSNNIGEFHYSNKQFDTVLNFDLNLIGIPNYIFLQNQRIIKDFIINYLNLNEEQLERKKKKLNIEHTNMIIDLNESINHKDVEDFDYSKRKKKKIILTTHAI